MNTPCVIYAAKSTEDVHDSLDTQVARCRASIEREGGRQLVAEPFTEEAVSGYKRDRGPKLEAAMRAAKLAAEEHGRAELWVFHSARLARGSGQRNEARALGEVFYDLRKRGVELRSVEDDPYVRDEAFVGMASKMAHDYSAGISAYTRAGKDRQFAAGKRLGGPLADGLRGVVKVVDGKPKTFIEEDPERAPIIRRIFELAGTGMGDPSIARQLNREGLRTQNDNLWRRSRVQSTLTNPVYAGRVRRFRDVRDSAEIPALIAPEVFDALQAARAQRDRTAEGRARAAKQNPRGGRHTTRFALAKLARCGRCGGPMYARTSPYRRKDGTHQRQYVCAQVYNDTGTCDQPRLDAAAVDKAVLAHLRTLWLDFDGWLEEVAASRRRAEDGLEKQLAATRQRLDGLRRAERKAGDKLTDALAADNDALADTYADRVTKIRAEVKQAEAAVQDAEAALATLEGPGEVDALLDFWNDLKTAVRGGTDPSRTLEEVNARLRGVFGEFRLETIPEGVIAVVPILRADAVRRYGSGRLLTVLDAEGLTVTNQPAPADSPAVMFVSGEEQVVPRVKALSLAPAPQGELVETGQDSFAYLRMK